MTPKIKNVILFSGIAVSLVLVYMFFIKQKPKEANLVSSSVVTQDASSNVSENINQNSAVTKEFLSVLLSVKGLKLDDSIFSDKAFVSIRDSSILLVPTGDEGRANPFAPIGFDYLRPSLTVPNSNTTIIPENTIFIPAPSAPTQ